MFDTLITVQLTPKHIACIDYLKCRNLKSREEIVACMVDLVLHENGLLLDV